MEKRQLDFNAPLLSARRYSSPSNSSELVRRKVVEKPLPSRQQSLPVNKSNFELEEVTKPAAVPFHWEQIPGRPKADVESRSHTPDEPSTTPRLPPGRLSDANRFSSGEITKLPPGRVSGPSRYCSGERSNDQNIYRSQVEAFSFNDHASLLDKLNDSLRCKDESDSESGDDTYSDALDTLSLTESRSFNYSVSGISGNHSSSGTFCVDVHTRDFMMNRFLPAAKAAVVETPKYIAKKPSVVNEQPKEVKKVVSGEMKPSFRQYSSDALPYYSQSIDYMESDDEHEDEYNVPVKKPGKAWGILPRFCVKNSLCLLNPIPAIRSKSRARSPSTPPREVRKMRRNAHSGPLDKNASQVMMHKKKFHSGLLSRDVDNKLTNGSTQFSNTNETYTPGVSPLRRYRSGSISPYRNESPKFPFREGVGFLGVPKEVENFNANRIASSRKLFKALQDVSKTQINDRRSGPVEKTVYVDYVKETKPPRAKAEEVVDPDTSSPNKGKIVSPKFQSTEERKPGCVADGTKGTKMNRGLDQECPEVPYDANFVKKEEQKLELTVHPLKSPLPPPLPKSPSESWLWRTLPSISLGNPFANSRQRGHKQGHKGSAINTKWETIVKTTNIRHDHVRYSEELLHRSSHRQSKY